MNEYEEEINNIDLLKEPPADEPRRQYYFISKARAYIKDLSAKIGRVPLACTKSFGCQMNFELAI